MEKREGVAWRVWSVPDGRGTRFEVRAAGAERPPLGAVVAACLTRERADQELAAAVSSHRRRLAAARAR